MATDHDRTRAMGELVAAKVDLEIEVSDSSTTERVPGLGWTLSDETLEKIREIDANIRAAWAQPCLPIQSLGPDQQ
ncbi:MAG TPA: hypothetical protein VIY48_15285 [Candidatus Paceibacterota bacterium]